jgi:hypothetical protein
MIDLQMVSTMLDIISSIFMMYNHTINIRTNTLCLGAHHSFILPLPSCNGVYHYYMSTLNTLGELSFVLDVFLMYVVTNIHIVFSHGHDLALDFMDP